MILARKSLKFILIALISFALIALPFYLKNVKVAEAVKYKFSESSTLLFKQLAYNKEMNAFFNKKIKKVIEGKGSRKNVTDASQCKDNVTTFCTATEAQKMFIQYRKELLKEKGNVKEELEQLQKAAGKNNPAVYHGPLVGLNQHKSQEIDKDIIRAEKALDLTLNAYNELQIAYPLHVQYQEMINNLERYRTHLEGVRSLTEAFPKVFVNATTEKCT